MKLFVVSILQEFAYCNPKSIRVIRERLQVEENGGRHANGVCNPNDYLQLRPSLPSLDLTEVVEPNVRFLSNRFATQMGGFTCSTNLLPKSFAVLTHN